MLSLGAVNKLTGEYVYPKIANKHDEYMCPECNKDLILCQGIIRIPYFRHKVDIDNQCHYYSSPNESQIHKDAKLLLKSLLEKKIAIEFIRSCISCKKNEHFEIPEITETSNIQIEYIFEYNGFKKIADVAYIDNSDILCIFEIYNTHKTFSKNRPEPWFEIDANTLIQSVNNVNLSLLQINCIRREKCEQCIEIDNKNTRLFANEININKCVYLNVPFSKKDMIKRLGGKWNKEHKLWYVSTYDYNKNKNYIHTHIGDKIIWLGHFINKCNACGGTGTSYWGDDCYGTCLECTCSECGKFHKECDCEYCEACKHVYIRNEKHECYLCEKCCEYTTDLTNHCEACCYCNKYTQLRTNGKCDNCYDTTLNISIS